MKVHLLLALLIGTCYANNGVCNMSDGSIGTCVKPGQCKAPDLGNLSVYRTIQMVCPTGEECCDFTDVIQSSSSPITVNNYVRTSNTNMNINYNNFNYYNNFQQYYR